MYAPQLTIPGYDAGLEDVFDELLASGKGNSYCRYSPTDTVDGGPALCGELIAWRHPTLGNYTDSEIAYDFVSAHDLNYSRSSFGAFECLIWLLSDESAWLPSRLRSVLIEGTLKAAIWVRDLTTKSNKSAESLFTAFYKKTRRTFRMTRGLRNDLQHSIEATLHELRIPADATQIVERFMERDFIGGFYDWQNGVQSKRNQKTSSAD
jgi:hypothetical protein